MKNTLTFMTLLLLSLNAFAKVCPTQISYKTWLTLDEGDTKRMKKILKKKGFIEASGGEYHLTLELSLERSEWKGTPTDSLSSAVIVKEGKEVARSEKSYTALMNDVSVSYEYGINEFVIAGASKEGVQRRMMKAIKALPSCGDLNEGTQTIDEPLHEEVKE